MDPVGFDGFSFSSGDGSGAGSGSGFGDGAGYGYGYGKVLSATGLPITKVTASSLTAIHACEEGVAAFMEVFPAGAAYPADLAKARKAGLDMEWAARLGLFVVAE